MKLILVRHGETDWVRQGRYQGSTDVPLNRAGFCQARALARLLKKERPMAVYSSGLTRARETAKLIGKVCRRQVLIDKRLNEVSFGNWEGFLHREICTRFPRAARKWYAGRWSSEPPGGESLMSLGRRISQFLKSIRLNFLNRNGTLIIVTHGGPIRMFLVRLLNLQPELFWRLRIDPASVSVVQLAPRSEELLLLNSSGHLIPPSISGRKGQSANGR